MGSNADRVIHNFKWRIESTAPAHTRPGKPFRYWDPRDHADGSPVSRLFWIDWDGEEDNGDSVTDSVERRARHRYVVSVLYTTDYDRMLLQDIMLQDRHDLIKTLRDTRLFLGTSSADVSSDIGLEARWVTSVDPPEYDDEANLVTLRLRCECEVWETE